MLQSYDSGRTTVSSDLVRLKLSSVPSAKDLTDFTFRDSARLPDYNIGEAMIVRAYKHVSLVYILNAKDFVKAGQYVTDPE